MPWKEGATLFFVVDVSEGAGKEKGGKTVCFVRQRNRRGWEVGGGSGVWNQPLERAVNMSR